MMNKKLVMLVVMFAIALPLMAATEIVNGITWTYTVSGGKASIGVDVGASPAIPASTSGAITIPSMLGGYRVTSIGDYALFGCSGLTRVTIPASVTSIGKWAFRSCSGLTSVTIPDGVTSIGDSAFLSCSGLTNITIGKGVTSIGDYVFYYCSGLISFSVAEGNPSYSSANGLLLSKDGKTLISGVNGDVTIPASVTSIREGAFRGYKLFSFLVAEGNPSYSSANGLLLSKNGETLICGVNGDVYVTIPDSVRSIGDYAFYGYTNLTSVTIGNSVTSIGDYAFEGCCGLTSLTMPASVISIGNFAFEGCRGLTNMTMPASVISIGNFAFEGCSGLRSVTIPDSVTSIGNSAFYGCSGATNVMIGSGVTNIGVNAFYGCRGLTSVTVPADLTSIGASAFANCIGLISFSVAEENPIYSSANGLLLSKNGETLICGVNGDVTIPGSVTSIGDRAFFAYRGLTSVTIPDSVTNIGDRAFYACQGLTSVTVPGSVTNIGDHLFDGCNGLTNVTMSEGVQNIGNYAFANCHKLANMSLPSTLKSRVAYLALFRGTAIRHLTMFGGLYLIGITNSCNVGLLEIEAGDGTTSFDTSFFAKAALLKPQVEVLILPSTVTNVEVAAINQLVNLTKIIFKGASRSAIAESDLQYLISSGLEVVYEDDGSGGGNVEPETPKLPTERMVRIVSSGIRADNPNIFDVTYVVSNMTETANVRILAFKDGVRSFANVLRPATFVDGTEVNVGSNVLANVDHTVSWNVADDWNIDLGRVTAEVLTLENCAIPLKLMTIPRTSSHAAVRFSYNPLTSAKVLDALFWHYASPESGLTLTDGVLASGGVVLANGTDVTAEGVRYVLEAHGYRLLEGEELEYVKRLSRLSLEPSGARQYGIVTLQD